MEKFNKQRRQLQQGMGDRKEHYKLYKAGKTWLIAGIATVTFGVTATLNTTQHVFADNTATSSSSSDTAASSSSSSVALKASSSTTDSSSSSAASDSSSNANATSSSDDSTSTDTSSAENTTETAASDSPSSNATESGTTNSGSSSSVSSDSSLASSDSSAATSTTTADNGSSATSASDTENSDANSASDSNESSAASQSSDTANASSSSNESGTGTDANTSTDNVNDAAGGTTDGTGSTNNGNSDNSTDISSDIDGDTAITTPDDNLNDPTTTNPSAQFYSRVDATYTAATTTGAADLTVSINGGGDDAGGTVTYNSDTISSNSNSTAVDVKITGAFTAGQTLTIIVGANSFESTGWSDLSGPRNLNQRSRLTVQLKLSSLSPLPALIRAQHLMFISGLMVIITVMQRTRWQQVTPRILFQSP
ncbi:KxYKxGKxW signal peptide domain-containing protein [Secundilactobacillus collinoides]|uniref:KxYKxGKxW signal peptide domain-containing protein n=1 Tax=Secundilactobacillus collinoides TaxID=33960 RepID=UPI0006CFEC8A|nr:KxYKxGKxW signal peptide domain-containing protein [Secundilactobacillus collinoides]